MKKTALLLSLAALAFAVPANAALLTFTESFDEPFAGWETRFFGTLSNATNVSSDPGFRGNNVTGLSVDDGNPFDGGQVRVLFNADFAATIGSFSFDLLAYNEQTLTVFDKDNATLFSTVLTPLSGPPFDFADANYTRFSVGSTNGVGGFSLLPFGAAGNVSIDDISITAVPEPTTWALMIGGFGLVGTALRRARGHRVNHA